MYNVIKALCVLPVVMVICNLRQNILKNNINSLYKNSIYTLFKTVFRARILNIFETISCN